MSVFLIGFAVSLQQGCTSKKFARDLSENLSTNIDTLGSEPNSLGGEVIYNPDIITKLYEKGGSLLSVKWNSRDKIGQMISAIRNAADDGLNPDDYHLPEIEKLMDKIISSEKADVEDVGRLELLLTDGFVLLSSHLSAGKTDPETIGAQWKVSRRQVRQDWDHFIDSTLVTGNIINTLMQLSPEHRDYSNLRKALAKYRQFESDGGWKSFTISQPKLEKGMRLPEVRRLRERLSVTQGFIQPVPGDTDLFDQNLLDQVIIFQQRNGLDPDGVVGKSTIEALNVPVRQRIETIEANLERWRWTSDNPGERYIRVNIADFKLEVIENGKLVFQSPAIVGRLYKETPVFSAMMRYIVLNPEWVIPPGILNDEIIPEVRKNPGYLVKNNMKITRKDGTPVDPSTIKWDSIPPGGFPFTIKQLPGPGNPLGEIKFVFPNHYNVYIHDTPSRSLFQRSNRTFSHGCIRISRAHELAEYLLKNDPEWSPGKIMAVIEPGREKIIILPEPVPVHILYLTARADDDGTAYFCNDVYNRDKKLISALKQSPPKQNQKNKVLGKIPGIELKIADDSLNKLYTPLSAVSEANIREDFK